MRTSCVRAQFTSTVQYTHRSFLPVLHGTVRMKLNLARPHKIITIDDETILIKEATINDNLVSIDLTLQHQHLMVKWVLKVLNSLANFDLRRAVEDFVLFFTKYSFIHEYLVSVTFCSQVIRLGCNIGKSPSISICKIASI